MRILIFGRSPEVFSVAANPTNNFSTTIVHQNAAIGKAVSTSYICWLNNIGRMRPTSNCSRNLG
jgi:hypothetical protein